MIKNLSVKSFQSHKNSKLELHPNVNIITGNSDSGKSAILRSINLIINNRPSGDSYRSNFGGDTEIELEINDNKISRIKTDKKNLYKLNDNVYEAFGTEIPDEIKKVINFSDINFQYQMDAPFLFSKSSGEVAKYINEIINLEIIDKSLSNIEKMKRDYNRKLDNERELLKTNQDEISKYSNLDTIESKIVIAEKLENEIESKQKKRMTLNQFISAITSIKLDIEYENKLLKYEKQINNLIELNKKIKELKEDYQCIIDDVKIIKDYKNDLHKINNYLQVENNYDSLKELNEKINNDKSKLNNLNKIKAEIQTNNFNLTAINLKLNSNEKEFNDLMPDICPLCGKGK